MLPSLYHIPWGHSPTVSRRIPTPSGHSSKLATLSSLLPYRWIRGYHAPHHRLIPHKPRSSLNIEHTPRPGLSWWSAAATHDFTTLLPMQALIHKWINQDPGIRGKHLDESQSQDVNPVLLGSSFSPTHLLPGGYAGSRTSPKTTQRERNG